MMKMKASALNQSPLVLPFAVLCIMQSTRIIRSDNEVTTKQNYISL